MFTDIQIDNQYITTEHVVYISNAAPIVNNPDALRRYAGKAMKKQLGDQVELGQVVLKKPGLAYRGAAKLLKKQPQARLLVTTIF